MATTSIPNSIPSTCDKITQITKLALYASTLGTFFGTVMERGDIQTGVFTGVVSGGVLFVVGLLDVALTQLRR